jgi:hypothetical protein
MTCLPEVRRSAGREGKRCLAICCTHLHQISNCNCEDLQWNAFQFVVQFISAPIYNSNQEIKDNRQTCQWAPNSCTWKDLEGRGFQHELPLRLGPHLTNTILWRRRPADDVVYDLVAICLLSKATITNPSWRRTMPTNEYSATFAILSLANTSANCMYTTQNFNRLFRTNDKMFQASPWCRRKDRGT